MSDELIKIASNGQWSLEKAADERALKERKMVQEFLARLKSGQAERANPPAAVNPYPAGMRPVSQDRLSTMNHRSNNSQNMPTEEERQAARAQADAAHAAEEPRVLSRQNISLQESRAGSGAPPKNAKIVAAQGSSFGRPDTSEATPTSTDAPRTPQRIVMPSAGNNPAPSKSGPVVERKPQLGPTPVVEQLGPMEVGTDEKGNRRMQPRQGRFHGEGATTRGKIVDRRVAYENKKTGERGGKTIPQLEQHHWSWDDRAKKWNHLRTTYTNASEGPEHFDPDLSLSRPRHLEALQAEQAAASRAAAKAKSGKTYVSDDDEE